MPGGYNDAAIVTIVHCVILYYYTVHNIPKKKGMWFVKDIVYSYIKLPSY